MLKIAVYRGDESNVLIAATTGGEGGEAPFTSNGWPAVSGAALSALTRAVAQEDL
jgi:hypothetical protein